MLLRVRRLAAIPTRSLRWATGALAAAALGAALVARRVAIEGDSMRPTLLPGDRVLAVRRRTAPPGALVVVRDPRRPSSLLVKRVVEVGPAGHTVGGDNPAASTDSRVFGPVPEVWGRVVLRYAPGDRVGRLR